MMTPAVRLACALALVSSLACEPSSEESSLEGRVFVSESVTPQRLVPGSGLRLLFRANDEASGSSGCNSITGHYEIEGDLDDGIFVLGPEVAKTLIGCSPEISDQEDWYFQFLGSSPAITVDGDALTLEGDGTRIEYLDEEVASPDVELTDGPWTVDTIIEGELASHADWPSPAVLVFADDGTMTIDTGCNTGTGSYTYRVSGMQMTFADVSVTELGCDAPAAELEAAVLAVLLGPQPVTWNIRVNLLTLRGENAGLDLVASGG